MELNLQRFVYFVAYMLYLQWIFMVLFKTIFKMKSLQQFFGGFYDMLPHSHMNVRILTKKHSME